MEEFDLVSDRSSVGQERDDGIDLEASLLDTSFINSKLSQDNLDNFKKDINKAINGKILVLEERIDKVVGDIISIKKKMELWKKPERDYEEELDMVSSRKPVYHNASCLHVQGPSSKDEIISSLDWSGNLLAVQQRRDAGGRIFFNVVVRNEFAGKAIIALHGQIYNGMRGICKRSNRQIDISSLIQDYGVGGKSCAICHSILSVVVVGEREKDSRELVVAGACRWDYYEGRDDFDSPQRIRKRVSSGKALYLLYFPFLMFIIL